MEKLKFHYTKIIRLLYYKFPYVVIRITLYKKDRNLSV